MKIVVLDGYTLNHGDLTWDDLKKFGEVKIYDRTPLDQVISRAKGAEIVLTNKTPLTRKTIEALPDVKYIGVLATGYDVVDCETSRELGIVVTNIPTYGTNSVAQFTFALLLELCNHVKDHSDAVKNGQWAKKDDFCFWNYPLVELTGKTIGIIGFGRIGQQTANIAEAFGMKVVAYNKNKSDQSHRKDFKWLEIDELLSVSDVVSLHCPLTEDTKGIINKDSINKMKNTAFLINTSRGPLINEQDLTDALNNETIAGAAVDVLSKEPPKEYNPLINAKNCIVTPHIAWATKDARLRLMNTVIENLTAFLNENPQNVVNL